MKKQNAILRHAFKVAFILFLLPTFECIAVEKQQQVLLDANGKPLSNELLWMLSSSSKKINQTQIHVKTNKENKNKSNRQNRRNPYIDRELLYYLKIGQIPKVTQLLEKGARPMYKNIRGETPLGIAVVRGWGSMVIVLIKHGANIHEKRNRGLTLLHIASAHGLTDMAKVLVNNGLSPRTKTDKDWTPLHVAARYGHWKLVQYYINQGVNPNIRNTDGNTALDLARHLRHEGVVKMLSRVTFVRSMPKSK